MWTLDIQISNIALTELCWGSFMRFNVSFDVRRNVMRVQLLREVEEEVTRILSDLIQIDTTNPPGNETAAAKYIAESLRHDGLECRVLESAAGRGNITTRMLGTGEKPSLLLLSHLDVVAANPEEWSVDPFGGVVKDGFVWGRGALDMKGMTAVELMALKLLKRDGVKLKGDVVLAATADEEMGGTAGAGWLLENFPEEILADYVLNEGGGLAVKCQEQSVFTVNSAEKGLLWLQVKAVGFPGHGSTPNLADNAILRMNKVIERFQGFRAPIVLVPTVKQFLSNMAKEEDELREPFSRLLAHPEDADAILDDLAKTEKLLAEELRPRIRMTIAPTMIHGGVKENVIPSKCEAVFDCRILPGQTVADAIALVKELLGAVGLDKLTFELVHANEPSESPVETPLYEAITNVLQEFEPSCGVTPVLMTGGTDSRYFRAKGSVCYGFHPMYPEKQSDGKIVKREHGIDERISIENLIFGTSVLYETIKRFMS
jgi:acetylornithine deacetylase/succinyl-diaminopimelate desuccinylase-like protein